MTMTMDLFNPILGEPGFVPPDIQRVKMKVDAESARFSPLWRRMHMDRELYRLKQYDGHGPGWTSRKSKGLEVYTTNEPQVVANKVIGTVAKSALHYEVSIAREVEEQRYANQAVKDFLMAAMKQADRRLRQYVRPPLIRQSATHAVIRGWVVGRVLLRNTMEGTTEVDITPWDPMNVLWGTDTGGLAWVCHKTSMTYNQIRAAHPGVMAYDGRDPGPTERYTVYDYYDRTFNMVFAEGLDIKKMEPHGDVEIPVYLAFTRGDDDSEGNADDLTSSGLEFMGESIYQSNRGMYDEVSYAMSVRKQMMAQAERNTLIYKAEDKSAAQLEKSPYVAGSLIPIQNTESIDPLVFPALGRDADNYYAMVSGEVQRGGLPHSAYGSVATQLSGTALQGLRDDYEAQATPFVDAVESAMQQICDVLVRQYTTGRFQPFSVPGRMDEMGPMLVSMADPVTVSLVPEYPHDMVQAAATAQILKEGNFMTNAQIRSKILRLQDVEGIDDALNMEIAEQMYPTIRFLSAFESALARGEEEYAQEIMYLYMVAKLEMELQLALLQMQAAMIGMQGNESGNERGGSQGGRNGNGGGNGPRTMRGGGMTGISPIAAPQQMLGMPTPRQSSENRPMNEPGRPRPGAQGRTRSNLLG